MLRCSNAARALHWAVASPQWPRAGTLPELPESLFCGVVGQQWLQDISRGKINAPDWPTGLALGRYFERLVCAALVAHPEVQLLATNLPIREEGRTLGECDALLLYRGDVYHLEIAVKFYLSLAKGEGQTSATEWVGPRVKDQLARKCEHIRDAQLQHGKHRAVREFLANQGIDQAPKKAVWMRGQGFTHKSMAQWPGGFMQENSVGWWIHARDVEKWLMQYPSECTYVWLSKQDWLGPYIHSDDTPLEGAEFNDLRGTPHMLAILMADGNVWHEISRGFVVPDDWPDSRSSIV